MAIVNRIPSKIQRVNHLNRTDAMMMRVYWRRELKGRFGPAWVKYSA